ncbi:MAG: hypothetical protein V7605_892, partial [Acidimicrobiaceae bacterium]
ADATPGSSVATSDAGGAAGGDATVTVTPTAVTGDSGPAHAASAATNSGDTGDSASLATAAPVGISGGLPDR